MRNIWKKDSWEFLEKRFWGTFFFSTQFSGNQNRFIIRFLKNLFTKTWVNVLMFYLFIYYNLSKFLIYLFFFFEDTRKKKILNILRKRNPETFVETFLIIKYWTYPYETTSFSLENDFSWEYFFCVKKDSQQSLGKGFLQIYEKKSRNLWKEDSWNFVGKILEIIIYFLGK